jgi:hypothetical protein
MFNICEEFLLSLPCKMDKFCIRAYSNQLSIILFDVLILTYQISKLRCSDKCKIGWVEKEDSPLSILPKVLEGDLTKSAI